MGRPSRSKSPARSASRHPSVAPLAFPLHFGSVWFGSVLFLLRSVQFSSVLVQCSSSSGSAMFRSLHFNFIPFHFIRAPASSAVSSSLVAAELKSESKSGGLVGSRRQTARHKMRAPAEYEHPSFCSARRAQKFFLFPSLFARLVSFSSLRFAFRSIPFAPVAGSFALANSSSKSDHAAWAATKQRPIYQRAAQLELRPFLCLAVCRLPFAVCRLLFAVSCLPPRPTRRKPQPSGRAGVISSSFFFS